MYEFIVKKVEELSENRLDFSGDKSDINILVLGLAFKKNVTDTRNSQVIKLVRGLTDVGYKVEVEDPLVNDNEIHSYQLNIRNKDKGNYDIVILAVDHDIFINQGYESIKNLIYLETTYSVFIRISKIKKL